MSLEAGNLVGSLSGPKAARASQMVQQLERGQACMERLINIIVSLEARLSPALRDESPRTSDPEEERTILVPLVEKINSVNDCISGQADRLESILERLEI